VAGWRAEQKRRRARRLTGAAGQRGIFTGRGDTLHRMSYTIRNLRDTEDLAPKHGLSELGEAHFPREELGSETIGLAYHVLRPGKRQGFAHRHSEAEEIYLVLSGDGKVKLDGDVRDVKAMDAIRVAPHVMRAFQAGGGGLEMLVFGPRHAGDGEMLNEGFWEDAEA